MTKAEMEAIAAYIDAAVELGVLRRLKEFPAPAAPAEVDTDAIVERVLARVPVPKDGADAVVDVSAIVKEVLAQLPEPQPGKDAVVDEVKIAKDVLALIPVPRDGEDGIATRDELHRLVDEKVGAAIPAATAKAVGDALATIPLVVYKGVWREGKYAAGSMVTWAGSTWHANEPTTEKPGDGAKSWTLAVKKGRDAK